jgi:CelD/BcsL family acetyltransferase involved in cellulose biosynthesis
MVVRVVPASSLNRVQLARWSEIQRSVASLASPFFCPEFTCLVSSVRNDVQVGLLEADDELVGFFPFQRRRFGVGAPVGSNLSDYHGIIAPEDMSIDAAELLRACGLKTWEFNHVPASQTAFGKFSRSRWSSTVMDLSSGFDAYARARRETGSSMIAKLGRSAGKLEREHGSLSYVQHTADRAIFELLLEWKQRQLERIGAVNIFRRAWIRQMLRLVHETQSDAFAGLLSVLYVGEEVVAVHLGMRSSTVLHSWFPAYDPRFARYSPGQILYLKMAESVPSLGIRAIDFGPGEYQHKLRWQSFETPLLVGMVEVPSLAAQAVRARRATKALVRRTSLAPRVRSIGRGLIGVVGRR